MAKKKTNQDNMQAFKEKLLAIRDRLRGNVQTMTDVALNKNQMDATGATSSMPIHMADIGSDNFAQEFSLSLAESEQGMLKHVEAALKRIEKGTYGTCEDCEAAIPKARLNALPFADKCVKCASK